MILIGRKKSFLNNVRLFTGAREWVLNDFESKLLPIKNLNEIPTPEPEPEQQPEPTVFATPKSTK